MPVLKRGDGIGKGLLERMVGDESLEKVGVHMLKNPSDQSHVVDMKENP